MMARIAPVAHLSQFFGIYALSGTATAFLGHGLVAVFTRAFQSQRAGFASPVILLVAGLVLMHWVREERAS
jgi:UMF1 family MFS transporter